MKQLAQYQDGRLELQDVPVPVPPPGGLLVRTTHSVISIGTEKMKVEQARMNLLQKARARPDQVRKVLDTARTLGWRSALEKVRNRLETPTPAGIQRGGGGGGRASGQHAIPGGRPGGVRRGGMRVSRGACGGAGFVDGASAGRGVGLAGGVYDPRVDWLAGGATSEA